MSRAAERKVNTVFHWRIKMHLDLHQDQDLKDQDQDQDEAWTHRDFNRL